MKKIEGGWFENNFQFEIINWYKRRAIKIKEAKSKKNNNKLNDYCDYFLSATCQLRGGGGKNYTLREIRARITH